LLPRIIGVATSETGAAIRDIIHVARRRDPNVGIVIAPCAVQGEAAVEDIVRAIERLNRQGDCDVLLVGRGGGSIEDLWAFNEERVARAIAASAIPVISCVGHETDFTIADFVADLRAPTPSAAAEMAVPVRAELRGQLENLCTRIDGAMTNGQRLRRLRLQRAAGSMLFTQPQRMLVEPRGLPLQRAGERLYRAMPALLDARRRQLDRLTASLRALNPEGVLERGYAILSSHRGVVTRVREVQTGEALSIRLSDGMISAQATAISPEVIAECPK
jgi:exodeoxyribonuclease VII large subunit